MAIVEDRSRQDTIPSWHATERAALYRWLAGLFAREPGGGEIARYRGPEMAGVFAMLEDDPALAEGANSLRHVLNREVSDDALAIDLASSFARLFLGAGGRRSAPPYESVYSGETGNTHGAATAEMQTLLRRYGLAPSGDFSEPPDHIAIQLTVMAELIGGEELEPSQSMRRQRDFLNRHLLSWTPRFLAACFEHDPSGFYAGLARLTGAFLERDLEHLTSLSPS